MCFDICTITVTYVWAFGFVGCILFVIFCHFGAIFSKIGKISTILWKWQKNDNKTTDQNSNDKKRTNKMTDKIEMTKKITKNDQQNDRQNWNDMKWQKNGKQNDKQNWNHKKMTTKATIEWHIIYFDFFNLCLPKFLLNLEVLHLFRWFTHTWYVYNMYVRIGIAQVCCSQHIVNPGSLENPICRHRHNVHVCTIMCESEGKTLAKKSFRIIMNYCAVRIVVVWCSLSSYRYKYICSCHMRFHSGSIQPECRNASSNIWRRYHPYVELGQVNMQEIVDFEQPHQNVEGRFPIQSDMFLLSKPLARIRPGTLEEKGQYFIREHELLM